MLRMYKAVSILPLTLKKDRPSSVISDFFSFARVLQGSSLSLRQTQGLQERNLMIRKRQT